MILIAIDPGYGKRSQGCAIALFVERVLAGVRFGRPESIEAQALSVCAREVVWEIPQVDARTRVSVPAVLQLAAVGGVLAGMYAGASGCRAVAVPPSTWKGSVPKPVAHGRLWALLTLPERQALGGEATAKRIEAAKKAGAAERWKKSGAEYYGSWTGHNLLDAVALGMWRLGRLKGK